MSLLLKMLRPGNMLIAIITLAAGFFISGVSLGQPLFLLEALALAAAVGFANVHNDILDVPADKINRPGRALASGNVSVRAATVLAGILFILPVLLGIFISFTHTVFFILLLGALYLYNARLKHIPLIKNISVALLCISPLALAYLAGKKLNVLIPLAFFAFLLTLAREILKDLEDIEGDRIAEITTLPLVIGIKPTQKIVQALLILSALMLPLPVFVKIYPLSFLILGLLSVVPFLVLGFRRNAQNKFRAAQVQIKIAMFCGIFTLILSFGIRRFF
jgi:4-hydroxybenzoate polyprenyltransferase/geranylgeranylglycerol-phosphate geranylgeranyltransferase